MPQTTHPLVTLELGAVEARLSLSGLASHLVVCAKLAELSDGLVISKLERKSVLSVQLVRELQRVLDSRVSAALDEFGPALAADRVLVGDIDRLDDRRRPQRLEGEVGEELPPQLVDRIADRDRFRLHLLQVLLLVILGPGAAVVLRKVRCLEVGELLLRCVGPIPRRDLARGQDWGWVCKHGGVPCRRGSG